MREGREEGGRSWSSTNGWKPQYWKANIAATTSTAVASRHQRLSMADTAAVATSTVATSEQQQSILANKQQEAYNIHELQRKQKNDEDRKKNVIIEGVVEHDYEGDELALHNILMGLNVEHLEREIISINRLGKISRNLGKNKPRLMIVKFSNKRAASLVCDKAPRLAYDRILWQVYIKPDLSLEERQRGYMERQKKRNKTTEAAMGAGAASASEEIEINNEASAEYEGMFESSQQQRDYLIGQVYGDGDGEEDEDDFEDADESIDDINDSKNISIIDIRHDSITSEDPTQSQDIPNNLGQTGDRSPADNEVEEGGGG